MKRLRNKARQSRVGNERGAVLIITVVAMTAALAIAAFAIDIGIWYVHSRHLQTQVDAAAFAGADVMATGLENGSCSNSAITSAIHQYDGSGQTTPAYNQQVSSPNPQLSYATNYSSTDHNLFSLINQKNFENQLIPADTGLTGNPCNDSATVDVKATETNLPSFISVFKPPYINKEAEIRAETIAEGNGSPFVVPNILTPGDVAVFVVSGPDKPTSFGTDSVLAGLASCADNGGAPPCLTSSNSGADWVASGLSVPFNSSSASLVVATSTSGFTSSAISAVTTGAQLNTFCTTPATTTCYDSTDGVGLTYTRTYTAATSSFPTGAPIIEDTALSDSSATATPACESAGSTGLFTGFTTSNTACQLNFSANINFGANESCSDLANTLSATLTITASSGGSSTLTCPTSGSTAPGSANGYWQSATPISVAANAGPITFDLTWSRAGGPAIEPWESGGVTSGSKTGQCTTAAPCTKEFNIVQRVFSGAYDQNSAVTSHSGTVAGAALTSAGSELFSTPANMTVANLGVAIDFQALADTSGGTGGAIPNGAYQDIAFGQNQGDGLADCGQGVSDPPQQTAIAGGFTCQGYPVIPSALNCSTYTPSTNDCPNTVPGNKFYKWLDGGMATRIYGCPPVGNPGGEGATGCTASLNCSSNPNYWDSSNTIAGLEANSTDPRLLTVMVTDPGNLANGNSNVPVRHYAEFYVTGWTGDPCAAASVSGVNSSNGLTYTNEATPPLDGSTIFLVGHFIKDFAQGATPSGQTCVESSIDNCTLTVTK